MNKVFSLRNDKSWKSLLVKEDSLLLINKSYGTEAEFMKGYEDEGLSRLLKSKKEISLLNITGLKHRETKPSALTVITPDKKIDLEFFNNNELTEVASYLANKLNLRSSTEQLGLLTSISGPLIALLITATIGWVIYTEAQILEAGGTVEISGRKQFVKKIFLWLAEILGTNGTIAVSAAIGFICLYFIYKNYKTPPNQVVYS